MLEKPFKAISSHSHKTVTQIDKTDTNLFLIVNL